MRAAVSFLVFFLAAGTAMAAPVISPSAKQICDNPIAAPNQVYSSRGKIITYYVPHNSQGCEGSIEGCVATSCRGLDAQRLRLPTCLDAVRLRKAKYVTLASDPSQWGKYFNIGTITYRSALDRQMYTVENVVGYVHDTGGAFYGRPDKLDVCTTACPTCTDEQAGALAQGKNVALIPSQSGAYDPNNTPNYSGQNVNPYSVLGSSGLSPFSLGGGGQSPFAMGSGKTAGVSIQQGAYASQPAQSSGGATSQNADGSSSGSITTGLAGPAEATIVAQSSTVSRGRQVVVSWSSIGMRADQKCRLTITLPQAGEATVAEENKGSQPVRISITASQGTALFRLHCKPITGQEIEKSVPVNIQ